ncbi:MAG: type II toxin-antitoxin system prevent-host-death family antitoxin [Candidatus Helarchaeota archaeon]|jgi:prevent-host-death family protein|nr:type II toxin-antitoxin system prevent-host-death family antitoxin [Candidatus Helarchaeota archaeon]
MRVANTVELKNKTNELLREVMKGNPLIITYRGKPAASILPLSEDDLEDFIIENSPSIRKKILKAEEDLKAGRVISLDEYLSTQKR